MEYISYMAIITKKTPKYFLRFSAFILIAIWLPIIAPSIPKLTTCKPVLKSISFPLILTTNAEIVVNIKK